MLVWRLKVTKVALSRGLPPTSFSKTTHSCLRNPSNFGGGAVMISSTRTNMAALTPGLTRPHQEVTSFSKNTLQWKMSCIKNHPWAKKSLPKSCPVWTKYNSNTKLQRKAFKLICHQCSLLKWLRTPGCMNGKESLRFNLNFKNSLLWHVWQNIIGVFFFSNIHWWPFFLSNSD